MFLALLHSIVCLVKCIFEFLWNKWWCWWLHVSEELWLLQQQQQVSRSNRNSVCEICLNEWVFVYNTVDTMVVIVNNKAAKIERERASKWLHSSNWNAAIATIRYCVYVWATYAICDTHTVCVCQCYCPFLSSDFNNSFYSIIHYFCYL